MAYEDLYRLSAHAAILNSKGEVLMLRATYGAKGWAFPGGAVDPGETIHETLHRECEEELGCRIEVLYLSGVYFHKHHNSHAFIFRCDLKDPGKLRLSEEHSEFQYRAIGDLKDSHRTMIEDCLKFERAVVSNKF